MLRRKTTLIFDSCFGFYSEEIFREMLVTERKRTGRSKTPFLFVSIDIGESKKLKHSGFLSKKIKLFIDSSTREVDIKGWYRRYRTIGIIYTEYNPVGRDTILAKIRRGLNMSFGTELASGMTISYSAFPEQRKDREKRRTDPSSELLPIPA